MLKLNTKAKNTIHQDDGRKSLPTLFDQKPKKIKFQKWKVFSSEIH